MIVAAPEHPSRDRAGVLLATASGDGDDAVDDVLQTLDLVTAEGATAGGRFEGRVDADHVGLVGHSAGGPAEAPPIRRRPACSSPARRMRWCRRCPRPARRSTPHRGRRSTSSWTPPGTRASTTSARSGTAPASSASPKRPASGFLDAQPLFRELGEDGCVPPAAPVDQAFPIVRHAVTSFLRWLFGADAEPVGLGPALDGRYPLGVTVVAR